MALCALPVDPQAAARLRAVNKLTIDPADFESPAAIFQRKTQPLSLLGGCCFESAPALGNEFVKIILQLETRLGKPLATAPSPLLVPAEFSAVPDAELSCCACQEHSENRQIKMPSSDVSP